MVFSLCECGDKRPGVWHGRCAAVLCIDGVTHYTDGAPAESLMGKFSARCDNQITTLEILAISVGLSTFCSMLVGRKVVCFSDNTAAEVGASLAWPRELGAHVALPGVGEERVFFRLGPMPAHT